VSGKERRAWEKEISVHWPFRHHVRPHHTPVGFYDGQSRTPLHIHPILRICRLFFLQSACNTVFLSTPRRRAIGTALMGKYLCGPSCHAMPRDGTLALRHPRLALSVGLGGNWDAVDTVHAARRVGSLTRSASLGCTSLRSPIPLRRGLANLIKADCCIPGSRSEREWPQPVFHCALRKPPLALDLTQHPAQAIASR
jgi:hypothetical protein